MPRKSVCAASGAVKGQEGCAHGQARLMGAVAKTEMPLLPSLGRKNDLRRQGARLNVTVPSRATIARDDQSESKPTPPMPIPVGSKAPDFTLKTKAADGLKDIKLSENFGHKKTVLLFFPAAFTGVCTQEMCDQTSGLGEYEKLGAQVYGISVDTPFALEAWAQKNKIGVTLLSDLNKTVIKAYDVVFQNVIGDTAARAAFVIGTDGTVKYAERTATPRELPNFGAIKAALAG
jgi:glutaredoxin-dependent peroxiredoxin